MLIIGFFKLGHFEFISPIFNIFNSKIRLILYRAIERVRGQGKYMNNRVNHNGWWDTYWGQWNKIKYLERIYSILFFCPINYN